MKKKVDKITFLSSNSF